jgi:hypothetical protein
LYIEGVVGAEDALSAQFSSAFWRFVQKMNVGFVAAQQFR